MTHHPLDGNAIAVDAHYGQQPASTECPCCDGEGYIRCDCWPGDCICGYGDETCEECCGMGHIDPDDDYGDHLYEQARDRAMEK